MEKFKDTEIVLLHETLKKLRVPDKLPPSEVMDRFVNIVRELLDILPTDDQKLAVYLYMSYVTLFDILSEKESSSTNILEIE